ncbi:facilitated trehalose transporter Tret1-like [Aricia agestis]|uniref:facilitated trehalose transporter Tret1-like n=1 Tax=Aricia agestis TaxID=91739 RepID=UPI001C20943E|nr:facilitated trehalose transporter Tret1-like [Aricia agestis]
MAPCCFIGGWLIEKFGRRQTLRTLGIPFFIGWIIIIFSTNFTQMIIGRFINGCSIGLLNPSMSVFISESSSPKLRGMFLALLSFSFALGIFVSHLIGTWVSWQGTAIISAFLPMASVIILAFVPESPVWLLSKGKIDDGIKAFYWLRGYGENAKDELKAMIEKFKSTEPSTGVWRNDLKKYNTPKFFKPLIITITFYLTCHYSGVHTITFYSVDIIEKAVGGGIDRYVAMLTIDALRVITTLITFLTSKNCPRRTLCILSGSLTAASMIDDKTIKVSMSSRKITEATKS